MAWQQNPHFFGIKKGIAGAEEGVKHLEAGSPFDYTVAPVVQLNPPGKHAKLDERKHPPNPSAFRGGRSVAHTVRPDDFLKVGSGFGGKPTALAKSLTLQPSRVEVIGLPPPTAYASPRNNPPNTTLRRALELHDLPCHINHNSGSKRTLAWDVSAEELDYAQHLPVFFDGLREQEAPLPFIAVTGITDMLAMAPHKVAAVVPQIVLSVRQALNTRHADVMRRTIVALTQLALADTGAKAGPEGAKIAKAMLPYFRQILPVINIFAQRYMSKKMGIDDEKRGERKVEDLIQVGRAREGASRASRVRVRAHARARRASTRERAARAPARAPHSLTNPRTHPARPPAAGAAERVGAARGARRVPQHPLHGAVVHERAEALGGRILRWCE